MKKVIIGGIVGIITLLLAITYISKRDAVPKHDTQTLIVGTNASFPPFEYKEGNDLKGFDIDLMHAIGKELNKNVVFQEMPFDSLLLEAQTGRIQVIASAMTPTEERREKLLFTTPYLSNDPLVVITLAKNTPKSLTDLKGKNVIVNDGYTAETFMNQQADIPLQRLSTPAEAFLALTAGRAYAYVSARSAVQPFFDRYGSDKFAILTLSTADSYALAVPKQLTPLFHDLQRALDVLEKNGSLTRLKKKWHLDFNKQEQAQ